jgi:hypothetical protein
MIYAAAAWIMQPLVWLPAIAVAGGLFTWWLADRGFFDPRQGIHAASRDLGRDPGIDDSEDYTAVLAALEVAETLVSAGHSANWEPNTLGPVLDAKRAELAPVFTANGIPGYEPAVVTVTDDPGGRHAQPRVHAFRPGPEPYCGRCGTAGHWRGDESCADAVVDELLERRRETRARDAIAADLEAAGFRYHDDTDDAVKSMFTRAMAMTVRAIEAP